MFGYLALSLLLLVVMAWFILQPFLVPATASTSARKSGSTRMEGMVVVFIA